MSDPLAQLTDIAEQQIREAAVDGYRLGLGTAIRGAQAAKDALIADGRPSNWEGFGPLNGLIEALQDTSASFEEES